MAVITAVVALVSAAAVMNPVNPIRLDSEQDSSSSPPPASDPPGPPRLVFAHYFPPYPISIDNKDPDADYYTTQYLNPTGEDGAYTEYGGHLRDRPLPRSSRPESDWKQVDLAEEIKQASSVGIDGFSVDILTTHDDTNWIAPIPSMLLDVAARTNPKFKIMLMPDMSAPDTFSTPQELASEMALLAASPAAFRLDDGRLVISPFLAENRPVSWWREFLAAMKTQYRIDVALVPVFLDPDANVRDFAPIAYGMSGWGAKNPALNPVDGFPLDLIHRVQGMGEIWMQPVSAQDYRPRRQVYDEAENTTTLRNMWQIAINGNAQWVQIVTWNDYSESTAVAPSIRHGTAWLDICSYYIAYFKHGRPPPIVVDRVFLSHRTQLIGATPSNQTSLASLREGSSPGRDAVEALSFLTKPATVTVNVGPSKTVCNAPAGVSTCVAPIGEPGPDGLSVSADVSRDDRSVVTVASPYKIVANPEVQDLSYTVTEGSANGP